MKKVIIGLSGLAILALAVVLFTNAQKGPQEVKKPATEVSANCAKCPSAATCTKATETKAAACDPAKCKAANCDPATCKAGKCDPATCKANCTEAKGEMKACDPAKCPMKTAVIK